MTDGLAYALLLDMTPLKLKTEDTMTTGSVVIIRSDIVCGRGATLRAAVADTLYHVDVQPDHAGDLIAGDSSTHTRYTTAAIAAAITAILADDEAKSRALEARRTREIATEREASRRDDRGL